MKLSILDQAPISTNQTSKEGLLEAVALAQAGEAYGYTRYWIAEHHDLPGLACTSPEVLLSYIGAHTKSIRLGSGATLLPHYKPYKIAESFHTLATLFPGRMDIGLGRAPGGSAEATNALSDNFLQKVYDMPNLVEELLHFIHNDFPEGHTYHNLTANPFPNEAPVPWILGTSMKSALLAAKYGLPYAFGQFMSEKNGIDIVEKYIDAFQPGKVNTKPEVIVAVSVVCAETTEKAEEIALSWLIWGMQTEGGQGSQGVPSLEEVKSKSLTDKEKLSVKNRKANMIIGNPQEVATNLKKLQKEYNADEMMIITITHSPDDRLHSYKLLADELL
ncbi:MULTISPECIES: LLM class flavin-dependent oxidoreductase [Bacillaceae]|uniref:LLM class flavin-dependent oxidoreductase n=1 Tax=Evansella alkalicola TaxID=745819 RepID=A0ABS6JQR9_9BACI|nr:MULTISPECIES: LLM class flavin-dependent oxidoreductase [Bacillaceae]MBU9720074.1 LLM class flavin-dependent oxidoreductase [Bacillus alkalicola]